MSEVLSYAVNPEVKLVPEIFSPTRADQAQYSVIHDSQRFMSLMATQDEAGFEDRFAIETVYIRTQLKTDLGERLKVGKSKFTYEIRDGLLYEPGRDEPFQTVMERGYRNDSRRLADALRESVEFQNWKSMQAILTNPDIPDGTMVLDFSPKGEKGTNYTDDYIDAHVKRGDEVVSTRYKSDLTRSQCRDRIVRLNPNYDQILPINPTDIDIKKIPVILPPHLGHADPDVLIESLIGKKLGVSEERLERVSADVVPLVTSYINILVERPWALYELEENYKAILGGAHLSNEYHAREERDGKEVIFSSTINTGLTFKGTSLEIEMLVDESEKMSGGACGSDGCAASSDIPVSPLDNIDGRGSINFRCPDCSEINTRELFQYVKNCQACGSDKVLPQSVREMSN